MTPVGPHLTVFLREYLARFGVGRIKLGESRPPPSGHHSRNRQRPSRADSAPLERNSNGASRLAESAGRAEDHSAVPERSRRQHDSVGVRIHYRETRSNCQRKTTRSGQETGLTAQHEAFLCHAHLSCYRRHSESCSLARPCKPPEHRGLSPG